MNVHRIWYDDFFKIGAFKLKNIFEYFFSWLATFLSYSAFFQTNLFIEYFLTQNLNQNLTNVEFLSHFLNQKTFFTLETFNPKKFICLHFYCISLRLYSPHQPQYKLYFYNV